MPRRNRNATKPRSRAGERRQRKKLGPEKARPRWWHKEKHQS